MKELRTENAGLKARLEHIEALLAQSPVFGVFTRAQSFASRKCRSDSAR